MVWGVGYISSSFLFIAEYIPQFVIYSTSDEHLIYFHFLSKKGYEDLHTFFFFCITGFELRAYTLSHSTSPFFVMGFFEVGSHNLFAQPGFELRSS
jgi:hypothetical protein